MLGPIFNREFLTVPRRARHYVLRTAYLGTLWVVGLTAYQTFVGWTHPATLGETAHFGAVLFQFLTWLMLALFLFFSALSAASSVAREKDRRTFVLLLMTDLRNSEIVLGKILGSLLPIWLLLATTIPAADAPDPAGRRRRAAGDPGGAGGGGDLPGCGVARWAGGAVARPDLSVAGADRAAGGFYLCLSLGAASLLGLIPALADQPILAWLDPVEAMCTVHDPLAAGHGPAYVFAGVMAALSALLNALGRAKSARVEPQR